MRVLDRLRLQDSPDHAVLPRPWDWDIYRVAAVWALGDEAFRLDVLLRDPSGTREVTLHFDRVRELRLLDGFRPLAGFRILDATAFLPEVFAPVCVLPRDWHRGNHEPYFWAESVERVEP